MAKRTGDDESRIVHGGELPEDDGSLDDVVVDASPAQSQPPAAGGYSTLHKRLMMYLKELGKGDTNPHRIMEFFNTVGHKFFALSDCGFDNIPGGVSLNDIREALKKVAEKPLQGILRLENSIPTSLFKKLISDEMDAEDFDYFAASETGKSLGLGRESIDISGCKNLGKMDLRQWYSDPLGNQFKILYDIADFEKKRWIPNDPYFLLLGVPTERRDVLSSYFDELRKLGEITLDDSVYKAKSAEEGGMKGNNLHSIRSIEIPMPALVKVARNYGSPKDLDTYKGWIDEFNKWLKGIQAVSSEELRL